MHFSQKYNKFLWFSWKRHVCIMFLIKKFFPWDWKRLKKTPPFLLPSSDLSSFYQWNRSFCSELMLIFSLQNLYLYHNFNEKTIHKVVSQHRKTKVKVPCLSLAISNNQKVYEKCQKHKPIKLPWKQLMILKSAGFYYLI